jgi:hypothetical protein
MADPISYLQLLENSQHIDYLLKFTDLSEDEKHELEYIWTALKSREESKFDAIINVIKECDKMINQLGEEVSEIKRSEEHWKKKRNNIINIIKLAYERKLISNKPTGNKYQATIKKVKSRLIDNFEKWSKQEKKEFGLKRKTITRRLSNNETISVKEEELPDKNKLRDFLEKKDNSVPTEAELIKRVSLAYQRRKRIKKSV